MRVKVQGGSEVNLTQREFLASGGEGQIYVIGDTTYKIYTDPSQMVPVGKIAELAEIKNPNIIKPDKLLIGTKNQPVGFTSKYIHNEGALCQIFTRSFRDRHGITPTLVGDLVKKLQGMVLDVHTAKCLMVDMNEMNFLLSPKFNELYGIDVASYQTPHYRATALMESVRDRHMKPGEFNEGTDWFAFGILSFQMFVGIHPYKGKHPAIKGLDERMLKNISVLHKDVGIPQTCYPVAAIPKNYLDWYNSVFEKGDRSAPPNGNVVVVVPVKMVKVLGNSAAIEIKEIASFNDDVVGVWENLGSLVVATKKSIYFNDKIVDSNVGGVTAGVGFTKSGKPIIGHVLNGSFVPIDIVGKMEVPNNLTAAEVVSYKGTFYLRNRTWISGLLFIEPTNSNQVLVGPMVAANVSEHATKLYSGVAIQNLLGASYVSLFPSLGTCHQVRIPELDGVRVIEAKFDEGVLMVVGSSKGVYNRFVFRFDELYGLYDTRVIANITPTGLNFVTLDSGVCVCMTEDETLELFPRAKGANKSRIIDDPILSGEMRLYKKGGKVVFTKEDKLYSLSMK